MHTSSVASVAAATTITITTQNFKFTPNVIHVKKGQKVTLVVKGIDGTHGFMIDGLGINQPVGAGETVVIDLPTGTAGTFTLRCSIPCGPGHLGMTGQVIID